MTCATATPIAITGGSMAVRTERHGFDNAPTLLIRIHAAEKHIVDELDPAVFILFGGRRGPKII